VLRFEPQFSSELLDAYLPFVSPSVYEDHNNVEVWRQNGKKRNSTL